MHILFDIRGLHDNHNIRLDLPKFCSNNNFIIDIIIDFNDVLHQGK